MKIRTSELIGPALDWAVAKALGLELVRSHDHFRRIATHWSEEQLRERFSRSTNEWMYVDTVGNLAPYGAYSTSWAAGGPIIEEYGINVCIQNDEPQYKISPSRRWYSQVDHRVCTAYGPTPLIAAMRCHVASKLGDVVDIPEELLK